MSNEYSIISIVIVTGLIIFLVTRCCFLLNNKRRKTNRRISTDRERDTPLTDSITGRDVDQTRITFRSHQNILLNGIIGLFRTVPETAHGTSRASPMVVPPYPVEPLHPTPHAPPATGFAGTRPPYPTQNPHPLGGTVPYPQPAAAPYPPVSTPYPPTSPPVMSSAPYPDYTAQPPSYSEAVAQPPVQPPLPPKDGYSTPYNPNY